MKQKALDKAAQLALITSLCGGQLSHVVNAAPSEVAAEAALAKSHDDSESTLDESDNVTILSPAMLKAIPQEQGGIGNLDLPAQLSRRFFKVRAVALANEEPITEVLDYEGLEKWADEVCSHTEAASVAVA